MSTNDFLDQNDVYASLKFQIDKHKSLLNSSSWRPPLQSFDITSIPTEKLLNDPESLRQFSFQYSSSDVASGLDNDVPQIMHVMDKIRSNSSVLTEMKGYPKELITRETLGFKQMLIDKP